jgi:F1F0 ATPase subunit 2
MNEFFLILLCFGAGIGLGTFFFGGLWLTMKRLPYSKNPAFLTMGSFFGRIAVCVFSFYLVVKTGDWEGLLASFGGFMIMRFALVRHFRPVAKSHLAVGDMNGRY